MSTPAAFMSALAWRSECFCSCIPLELLEPLAFALSTQ
eukprot:CAMPEP_0117539896 /NCGR_PEP_ID=MMETSP0784-20121206/43221_1 /TAXON_ID=39447 /ORGANISM="" /LENGTH=37 /DNA_ID= /DNA_START= /DNA_END= /DNA_ORIENTATION=